MILGGTDSLICLDSLLEAISGENHLSKLISFVIPWKIIRKFCVYWSFQGEYNQIHSLVLAKISCEIWRQFLIMTLGRKKLTNKLKFAKVALTKTTESVTFTEKILNEKLHFLCIVNSKTLLLGSNSFRISIQSDRCRHLQNTHLMTNWCKEWIGWCTMPQKIPITDAWLDSKYASAQIQK